MKNLLPTYWLLASILCLFSVASCTDAEPLLEMESEKLSKSFCTTPDAPRHSLQNRAHEYHTNLIDYDQLPDVKVFVNTGEDNEWPQDFSIPPEPKAVQLSTLGATAWNNTDGHAKLNIVMVDNPDAADVTINFTSCSSEAFPEPGGNGFYPNGGLPGTSIFIFLPCSKIREIPYHSNFYSTNLNADGITLAKIVQHEVGHTLGLHHTDGDTGEVFCEIGSSNQSIMFAKSLNTIDKLFYTANDQRAISLMYPLHSPDIEVLYQVGAKSNKLGETLIVIENAFVVNDLPYHNLTMTLNNNTTQTSNKVYDDCWPASTPITEFYIEPNDDIELEVVGKNVAGDKTISTTLQF